MCATCSSQLASVAYSVLQENALAANRAFDRSASSWASLAAAAAVAVRKGQCWPSPDKNQARNGMTFVPVACAFAMAAWLKIHCAIFSKAAGRAFKLFA